METDTKVPTERPSEHAVVVPVKQLMDEELDRRIELIRERDNVGRGEAFEAATEWLQSQTKSDLLADVERGLYRIWYSHSKHSGNFQEVAIWFEGTLYGWPSTSAWLSQVIREGLDDQCQSIGTFFRSNEHVERKALENETKESSVKAGVSVEIDDHAETADQDDVETAIEHGQHDE